MKKIFLSMVLSLPLCVMAQQDGFRIEGKLKKASSRAKVYLSYRTQDGAVTDSLYLQNGKFVFKGQVSMPTMMTLTLLDGKDVATKGNEKTDSYTMYVEKGVSKLSAVDSISHAVFSGPKLGSDYLGYSKALEESNKALAKLSEQWYSATDEERKEGTLSERLMKESNVLASEKRSLQHDYITKNPASYFSLIALQDIAGFQIDATSIEPIFAGLDSTIRNTFVGKNFAKLIEASKLTAIGALAPDFTQYNVDDKPVKLSDFRGQYVLLDFWASWCGPCRAENPHVVAAYHKYKNKNFTVLGVSLDYPGKKANWLKAIEEDKLEWTQVSDLQGWKNAASTLYGIRGIPQNYLIGPDGKIVAVNLRGEELDKKLSEIIGL